MPQWPQGGVIRFGAFEVEPQAGILRKGEARIRLQEQPFQVLLALLEKPGQLITREELHQKVWNGEEFGDLDHRLNIAVNKVREALRDSTENPRFVETLPKRGYRFVAPLEGLPAPAPQPADPSRSYRRFAWIAAGLLALAAAGLWLTRARAPLPPSRVVPLTTFIGYESAPAFSPDGTHVAFAWNGEKGENWDVYVKRVGNVTALRLTSDPAGDTLPAWSPDGRQIAFVSRRDGGGIYLVSPEGGPQRRVSDLPTDSRPSWAPDGKSLLVARRYDQTHPEPGDGALFLVPVEGEGAPRQILAPPRGAWYQDPAFAPDGRSLAFASCPGTSSGPRCSLQVAGLQVGLVRPGKPRQITEQTWEIHGLVWMPDGSSLIYAGHIMEPNPYLWRVNVRNGKEPERLELAGDNAWYPAIDFKAGRLAFQRGLMHENIWRLERGGQPAPFLTSSARDRCPQYSPDGRRIAFASTRQVGNYEIWVANADGTGPAQITSIGSPSGTPRWSPDGRWLAFDAFEQGLGWDVWKWTPAEVPRSG